VAVVAVASVLIFVIPWVMSSRLREQIKKLKADAALGEASGKIAVAREQVDELKAVRDQALADEQAHAAEEDDVDGRIAQIDKQLDDGQAKVKEQTDNEQADWFRKRYPD
jgi:phage I-like protein